MQTTLTSKGQVTIPRDVRRHFGLKQGMAITFEIEGDHIALRAARMPCTMRQLAIAPAWSRLTTRNSQNGPLRKAGSRRSNC